MTSPCADCSDNRDPLKLVREGAHQAQRMDGAPDPARVPAAVRALSQMGALREPESAGAFVGFIAGVIGSNPARAEELSCRTERLTATSSGSPARYRSFHCRT